MVSYPYPIFKIDYESIKFLRVFTIGRLESNLHSVTHNSRICRPFICDDNGGLIHHFFNSLARFSEEYPSVISIRRDLY